ncbi:MAG: hypothetical protein ACYSTG_07815, partial [Planctomycetota bacterium]
GKIHILDQIAELARRQYPHGRPGELRPWTFTKRVDSAVLKYEAETYLGVADAEGKRREIKKEGLSEYFLYTIEGEETIPTGWSKRMLSFEAKKVPVINLYKYDQRKYGNAVVRFLSFKNDTEHDLGKTPIPGGMLKVYRTVDQDQHLSYVGQSSFKYIPVDEDVELNLGPVADVVVEPTLMDFKTERYTFNRHGNISGWDEVRTFKVEVRNTRDLDVKIEIKRRFDTNQWKLEKGTDFSNYEQLDKNTVKFTLLLEPRTRQQFNYILRTYHGEREEEWEGNR